MKTKKVQIMDINGNRLYMNLIDTGDNIMCFEGNSGGFIAKDQCVLEKWKIELMGD